MGDARHGAPRIASAFAFGLHFFAKSSLAHACSSPAGKEFFNMSQQDNSPVFGRFEHGIIKRKVRQIIGRAGYTRELEEICS